MWATRRPESGTAGRPPTGWATLGSRCRPCAKLGVQRLSVFPSLPVNLCQVDPQLVSWRLRCRLTPAGPADPEDEDASRTLPTTHPGDTVEAGGLGGGGLGGALPAGRREPTLARRQVGEQAASVPRGPAARAGGGDNVLRLPQRLPQPSPGPLRPGSRRPGAQSRKGAGERAFFGRRFRVSVGPRVGTLTKKGRSVACSWISDVQGRRRPRGAPSPPTRCCLPCSWLDMGVASLLLCGVSIALPLVIRAGTFGLSSGLRGHRTRAPPRHSARSGGPSGDSAWGPSLARCAFALRGRTPQNGSSTSKALMLSPKCHL